MARPKKKVGPELPHATIRLEEIISELGLSRGKFAERLGMSTSGLGALFLKEGARLSVVQAKAIELEFGVNHRWLLNGEAPKFFAQYDHLLPSERWLLKQSSPVEYPSLATMVEIPLTLAVLFFQRQLLRLQAMLFSAGLESHEVVRNLVGWQGTISQRLRRDWLELKEAIPIRSRQRRQFADVAVGVVPEDQMRQWQTARYYFMDLTVLGEELRPSKEAAELEINLDQPWIDEHYAQFLKEWDQLCALCEVALNKAEYSLLDQQTLSNK
jgi:transcriptional regulator with XRE-family HTH domain